MKAKYKVMSYLKPVAHHYRVFKWLSIIQVVIVIGLPLIKPDIQTSVWMLGFSIFAFWLSNYAILRMAHFHEPNKKGIAASINRFWENLIFSGWLLCLVFVLYLILKNSLAMAV